MNTITLSGRLIKDAEQKFSSNNKIYSEFTISVYKGKDSDGQNVTFLVNVTAWNCELSSQLTKGTTVIVNGKLDIESYNGKYYTKVITTGFDSVAVIPQRAKAQNDNYNNAHNNSYSRGNNGGNYNDDIPF